VLSSRNCSKANFSSAVLLEKRALKPGTWGPYLTRTVIAEADSSVYPADGQVLELTLGSVAPELSINASDNLSSTDVDDDGLITLDVGFKWAGDPNIVILLKSHGIPLVPAQLKKFQLYGKFGSSG